MENFSALNLDPSLARAIGELGYEKPTPIQAQTIPVLLSGRTDFLGMAATGTGKTAAFAIPLINNIDATDESVQGLVLCPTRELAIQVAEQITRLGLYSGVRAVAIYGGAGYGQQFAALESGPNVVVATPGRLIDHLERGSISLASVRITVLDEADEMISMGFKEAIEFVLDQTDPEQRNIWLFSATMSSQLRRIAETYLNEPKVAEVNRTEVVPAGVEQIYYTVREKNKPKVLCKLIDYAEDFYGLIFCDTKMMVTDLTEWLRGHGYRVDCLHGDMAQGARERSMDLLKERQVNILVCTDVAARGLHVDSLTHVINYSLPRDLESYVHRIGRTARSEKKGIAVSLVTPVEVHKVSRLEKITKSKMTKGMFPSLKQISVKRLETSLPRFLTAPGTDRAHEVLTEKWKEELEKLTKEEIAPRFLALAFPELFDPPPEEANGSDLN